jgi:hypothetical protein
MKMLRIRNTDLNILFKTKNKAIHSLLFLIKRKVLLAGNIYVLPKESTNSSFQSENGLIGRGPQVQHPIVQSGVL